MALCAGLIGALASAVAEAQPQQGFLLLKLDGAFVKWGDPALGTGATVRYAFVTERTETAGARNCGAMVPLEPALRKHGVAMHELRAEAAAAFAMWESAANIRFEHVVEPERADILIGAQLAPLGRAFANVSYGRGEQGTTRRIEKALICLNQHQPWKVGFGGNPQAYDLRYTIAHEIGHAIGLNHPGPGGALMGFNYAESFRGLQPGDAHGAVALYGSRDGTKAAATPRGAAKPAEMGLR